MTKPKRLAAAAREDVEGHSRTQRETVGDRRKNKKKRGRGCEEDRGKHEEESRDSEDEPSREAWSKSKKKRMRKLKAKQRKQENSEIEPPEETDVVASKLAEQQENSGLTVKKQSRSSSKSELQKSFRSRLSGSRFRILNEELYTTTSSASFERFQAEPDLYEQYHAGFRHQVEQWPVNPVTVMVESLKKLVSKKKTNKRLVVADFGCGDAELARQLLKVKQSGGGGGQAAFLVHSFDLVAANDLVTACDMAHVPLQASAVDVGVFCLSLMGTNLADFVREAHRVLRGDGVLKIAEVRSRFETGRTGKGGRTNSNSGSHDCDRELQKFLNVLDELGFECTKTDRSNKMFLLLELRKNGKQPKKDLAFTAKPCIYKRR